MAEKRSRAFRVIAVNLHSSGVENADRLAGLLRDEGWPRATRSLVIREALERMLDELRERSPEEVFQYFVQRRARRAAGPRIALSHRRDVAADKPD